MEETLPGDPKVNYLNHEHPSPNPDPNSLTDHPQESLSSCQFPSKPMKAIAALIFLICSGLVCTFTLVLTNQRVPEVQPLCDLVMDNVPRLQEGLIVCEIIMLTSAFISFVTIILHSCRLIIFRRVFFISGLLYIYRSITMALTVLPKPDMEWDCPKISGKLTADIIFESVVQMSSGGFFILVGGPEAMWGLHLLRSHHVPGPRLDGGEGVRA
jgi:shingomyelin synthase